MKFLKRWRENIAACWRWALAEEATGLWAQGKGSLVLGDDEADCFEDHLWCITPSLCQDGAVLKVTLSGTAAGEPQNWGLEFAALGGQKLAVGMYDGALRYEGIPRRDAPSLNFSGNGRCCSTLAGWFDVRVLRAQHGMVESAAIDFVQYDEGDPKKRIRGSFRYFSRLGFDFSWLDGRSDGRSRFMVPPSR